MRSTTCPLLPEPYSFHRVCSTCIVVILLLLSETAQSQTWTPQSSGITQSLLSVWSVSNTDVWSSGGIPTPLHYDGFSWQPTATGSGSLRLWGANATNIWGANPGGIWKYDGSTWTLQLSTFTFDAPIAIWGVDVSQIWAVGRSGIIRKYNGVSWTTQQTLGTNLTAVWGANASNVWAVGASGTVGYHDGSSWISQPSGTTNGLNSIWGTNASNVWAVGANGTILKYNGSSWISQSSGTTVTLRGIYGLDANNIWAVGDNGTILKYDGFSWAPQNSGTTNRLSAISGSGAEIWAVGDLGTILYFYDPNITLPIEMTNFEVRLQSDRTTFLHWQTASERNNKGFDIEHSTEGKTWASLGFVAGKGTTSEKQTYQFTHSNPSPGTNYYRLAQQDFDGAIHYSDIQNVVLEGLKQKGCSVYPNPVMQGELTVQLHSEPEENATISIYTSDGRLVLRQPATANVHTFATHGWTPGTYFIEIKNGAQSIQEQVVVK